MDAVRGVLGTLVVLVLPLLLAWWLLDRMGAGSARRKPPRRRGKIGNK